MQINLIASMETDSKEEAAPSAACLAVGVVWSRQAPQRADNHCEQALAVSRTSPEGFLIVEGEGQAEGHPPCA